jgi:hypothetical protein
LQSSVGGAAAVSANTLKSGQLLAGRAVALQARHERRR